MSKPKTITATLVRGETFICRDGQVFRRGKPQQVTPAMRAYLEQHALEVRHYPARSEEDDPEGETRVFPKFEFAVTGAQEETNEQPAQH